MLSNLDSLARRINSGVRAAGTLRILTITGAAAIRFEGALKPVQIGAREALFLGD